MNQYEGMFLLDNQAVRVDYKAAKALVFDMLKKHGAELSCARRFDERRLAYPIQGRQRATYLLTYFKAPAGAITPIKRDAELDERILRNLLIRVDEIPAKELELAAAEGEDYMPPPPPADDAVDREEPLASAPPVEEGETPEIEGVAEEVPASLNDDEEA